MNNSSARSPEEVMVGPLVRVEPNAAMQAAMARARRRSQAAHLFTIERDGEEVEVSVDVEWVPAEPDVGCEGGFAVGGAIRIDNGESVELTRSECDEIAGGLE